jgi:hypothetical protein
MTEICDRCKRPVFQPPGDSPGPELCSARLGGAHQEVCDYRYLLGGATFQFVSARDITRWMVTLFERFNIAATILTGDQGAVTMGLLNVPAKYVGIIDTMQEALARVGNGKGLPQFTEAPPGKGVKRKR